MLVVISFYKGDLEQARSLAGRMAELGPYPGHKLLTLRDTSADENPFNGPDRCGFDAVREIVITDTYQKWPESPNQAFRTAAVAIEYSTKPEPWLLIEPDVVPILKGWLDAIADAYNRSEKPFFGAFVPGFVGTDEQGQPVHVPDHMSGVAVYPGDVKTQAGAATIAMEIPWDVEGATQIVPKMQATNLIQHNWRPPPFDSLDAVRSELKPETVLYHKDKSGKMAMFLSGGERRENDGKSTIPANQEPGAQHPGRDLDHANESESKAQDSATPAAQKSDPESGAELPPVVEWSGKDSDPIIDEHGRFKANLGRTTRADQAPWINHLDTITRIQQLARELKTYCDAPVHTAKVRKELKAAKVITKL